MRSGYNQLYFQLLHAFGMQGKRECVKVKQLFASVLGAMCNNEGSEKGQTEQPSKHQTQSIFLAHEKGALTRGYMGMQRQSQDDAENKNFHNQCIAFTVSQASCYRDFHKNITTGSFLPNITLP